MLKYIEQRYQIYTVLFTASQIFSWNEMECKLHNTGAAGLGRGVAQRQFLETSRVAEALLGETFQSDRGPPLGQPAAWCRLHWPGKVTQGNTTLHNHYKL